MALYTCAQFVLFSAYELLIKSTNNGYGKEKSPIWEFFSVVEDSRFAKCKKFNIEVPRGGQSTKTFTPTNLVHHLKTKPGHEEEYERYNKLKTEEKKKQSSTTDGTRLRQVSLQEMAELRKVWDINDSSAKRIHTKVGEIIATDCQPICIVDNEGFKSLISTLEPKYQMPSRKYFTETYNAIYIYKTHTI